MGKTVMSGLSLVISRVERMVKHNVEPLSVALDYLTSTIYAGFRRSFAFCFFAPTFRAYFYEAEITSCVRTLYSIKAQTMPAIFAIHTLIVPIRS
jgi:hypothetical protein